MRCGYWYTYCFLILKAIGILILVLLGLVLAVVCLVLFVPVCYEAGGSWKEQRPGKGKFPGFSELFP